MTVRTQMLHPLTGRRMSITANTKGQLQQIKREIREIADDVRIEAKSVADGLQRIEEMRSGIVVGGRLPLRACLESWAKDRQVVLPKPSAFEELEHLPCVELTDARLSAWAEGMKKEGFAPGTIGAYFDVLAAAVRSAVRRGQVALVPWKHFRPPRSEKGARPSAATSVRELARIVAAARLVDLRRQRSGLYSDLACRVIVLAMTGMRNGEAAGLGWDHIDFEAEGGPMVTICVQAKDGWRRTCPGKARPDFAVKGRRGHVQRLHFNAAIALMVQADALRARGWYAPDGPVFPSPRTGGWRPNANAIAPEEIRELARAVGLSGRWVTHSLRHTFATLEANAPGGSARAAQMRIGHASLAQTDRYVHDAMSAPPSAIPRLPASAFQDLSEPKQLAQSNPDVDDDEDPNGTIH
jgi:integrase